MILQPLPEAEIDPATQFIQPLSQFQFFKRIFGVKVVRNAVELFIAQLLPVLLILDITSLKTT